MNEIAQNPSSLVPICLSDVRLKFVNDGVVFPLQLFEGNKFHENNYPAKYQEFRNKCDTADVTISDVCSSKGMNDLFNY